MKKIVFGISILMFLIINSCQKEDQGLQLKNKPECSGNVFQFNTPALKIAVVSDLHYMDPSLLKSDGSAFQMYLMQDPKLLAQSNAIIQQLINKLLFEKPDLLLITGDLTKDGELAGHRSLIKKLNILLRNKTKILVVPGNHDINNPDAKLFDGDNAFPVPSITADDFKSLYADFGYRNPVSRDPNSLSYVAEPYKGLWVLAIDANEYYNNTSDYCVVAGKIKDSTMDWIKTQLALAKAKGKTVIGMMHHGLVEHFMGESMIFPDYLVENYGERADELIQAGLKVIFTGHFHANDATAQINGPSTIVDIETGSQVIWESPYRIVKLINNKLLINTKHIERIIYPGLNNTSFPDFEKTFSLNGFEIQARYMLMNPPYYVPEDIASQISPVFAQAMLQNFGGDETITPELYAAIESVAAVSPDLGNILLGLVTDLPPSDNQLTVDLN
jgi:3',5'-cyclic AMP phosphodiesterase CpdA